MFNDEEKSPTGSQFPNSWELVLMSIENSEDLFRMKTRLIEDMRERDVHGFEHYGIHLQPFNGRDALIDMYQELLDLIVYTATQLYEEEINCNVSNNIMQRHYDYLVNFAMYLRYRLYGKYGR